MCSKHRRERGKAVEGRSRAERKERSGVEHCGRVVEGGARKGSKLLPEGGYPASQTIPGRGIVVVVAARRAHGRARVGSVETATSLRSAAASGRAGRFVAGLHGATVVRKRNCSIRHRSAAWSDRCRL